MKDRLEEKRKRKLKRRVGRVAICLACVLLFTVFACVFPFKTFLPAYSFPVLREGEVRIHFLSVGQGDCAIVQLESRLVIVDAGDGSWHNDNHVYRYLKGLAPEAVTLVATHADIDHFGGFSEIIRYFPVEKCYLPLLPSQTKAYERFLSAVKKSEIQTDIFTRYDKIVAENGAYFVCLSPYPIEETEENRSSTLLYFEYDGVRALFGGDTDEVREKKLAREHALDERIFDSGAYRVSLPEIDVLKVSHHGSKDSSAEEWISLLAPKTAIISCGAGNPYYHPTAEALKRLSNAELYRTDELGDIVVSIYQGKHTVFTRFTEG